MRFHRKYFPSFCFSMFLCLLASCVSNGRAIDIGDGGLLSGRPCAAPCFQNITPGITTKEQALKAMASMIDPTFCDHWDRDSSGREAGMRCSDIGLTYDNLGRVSMVSYRPTQTITVGELVDKYGNPSRVGVSLLGIEMQPPTAMRLYFDEAHMVVYLQEQNSPIYHLQASTRVESVAYDELSKYNIGKDSSEQWKGFGQY